MNVIELNICLVPHITLSDASARVSSSISRQHHARVILDEGKAKLSTAPHVTLYQVPLPLADLACLFDEMKKIASLAFPLDLVGKDYCANDHEGSFEVVYEVNDSILSLQRMVINAANPLRGNLLLERDPAGNSIREILDERADELAETESRLDNLRRIGFSDAGMTYSPHLTLTWLSNFNEVCEIDVKSLSPPTELGGVFDELAVFCLGPRGTTPQKLASWKLGANMDGNGDR